MRWLVGLPRRGERTGQDTAVWAKRPYLAEQSVKIGANLSEEEAKALKTRLEAELASTCGGGSGAWTCTVYEAVG
jgi:NCAIR mutase (PurE)-related protein